MRTEKISLYYCSGTSDKEYHAAIEPQGDGFVVTFAYGRRGNSLQTGSKTQEPVPYEKAKSIFDKLVKEKTDKGYSPGASGTPYQQTPNEQRATGILPQLLNAIEEEDAERLIADDRFWMQQKFDGKRILTRKDSEGIIGINRKGLAVALPKPVVAHVKQISVPVVLDGESCGAIFYAFDVLEMNNCDMRELSYSERLRQLENLLYLHGHTAIRLVETAKEKPAKAQLFARLQQAKAEGVVFKKHDSPYIAGRPSSGGNQLKFKFYATASCMVAKVNAKRSVALELFGGSGRPVNVGNVTIPANHPVPPKGAIIDVKYLYAFPQGSLFQPTYLGERDDIGVDSCIQAQLKYKADVVDEDDA